MSPKKKEEELIMDDDLAECPTCGIGVPDDASKCPECGEEFDEGFEPEGTGEGTDDLAECPKCGSEIAVDASKCPDCGENFEEGFEEEAPLSKDLKGKKKDKKTKPQDQDPEDKKIGFILLIVGLFMSLAGIIGVVGLRVGFIQALLGDASPYPGIGTVEPSGHIVSVIPFVIGLITIFYWGLKNDPIYYEKEKMKEEDKTIAEKATPEEITTEEELYDEIDSLDEEEIETELEHIFDFEKEEVDEEVMIQCREMLSEADVSDRDRTNLTREISDEINIEEFSEKLQEAVEKKKKEFEKMSADEKGQSLEDELAAELAELEDELDEEDDDIEEKILKEIEDLENL